MKTLVQVFECAGVLCGVGVVEAEVETRSLTAVLTEPATQAKAAGRRHWHTREKALIQREQINNTSKLQPQNKKVKK